MDGNFRGKNKFRCKLCFYQWTEQRGKRTNYFKFYNPWLFGRRTLSEICTDLDISYAKLIKEFDKFDYTEGLRSNAMGDIFKSINLRIDATFFGREYGFLVFHDGRKVIYSKRLRLNQLNI